MRRHLLEQTFTGYRVAVWTKLNERLLFAMADRSQMNRQFGGRMHGYLTEQAADIFVVCRSEKQNDK